MPLPAAHFTMDADFSGVPFIQPPPKKNKGRTFVVGFPALRLVNAEVHRIFAIAIAYFFRAWHAVRSSLC